MFRFLLQRRAMAWSVCMLSPGTWQDHSNPGAGVPGWFWFQNYVPDSSSLPWVTGGTVLRQPCVIFKDLIITIAIISITTNYEACIHDTFHLRLPGRFSGQPGTCWISLCRTPATCDLNSDHVLCKAMCTGPDWFTPRNSLPVWRVAVDNGPSQGL